MSNRLKKTDFLAVYLFLLVISFFIGGFFLGANVAQHKAKEEFARYLSDNDAMGESTGSLKYSHTDFASYYYNIYLPFNEFRKHYLHYYHQLHRSAPDAEQKAVTLELRNVIKKMKGELNKTSITDSSPLLQKSQAEYIAALNAYELGVNKLLDLDSMNTKQISNALDTFLEFKQGEQNWLQAQSLFYESVILWDSFYVTKETPVFIEKPGQYTLDQWTSLRFHQKNDLIAKIIAEKRILSYFNPEDVVVYLDSLVVSASSIQLDKVADAVDFLTATGSILQGEFIKQIDQYAEVSSPMIPLFSK